MSGSGRTTTTTSSSYTPPAAPEPKHVTCELCGFMTLYDFHGRKPEQHSRLIVYVTSL